MSEEPRFRTGTYEQTVDLQTLLIPKRTAATIFEPFRKGEDGCVIVFNFIAQSYARPGDDHSVMFAMNQDIACGIITQLTQVLFDAGMPESELNLLMAEAQAAFHMGRRVN